jgi:hypothetical protein
MIMFGVDAHKRSHTIVAVDDLGKQVATITVGTTTSDHLDAWAWSQRSPVKRRGVGRWRTAGICPGGWSGTCWRPASSWCGCRRS